MVIMAVALLVSAAMLRNKIAPLVLHEEDGIETKKMMKTSTLLIIIGSLIYVIPVIGLFLFVDLDEFILFVHWDIVSILVCNLLPINFILGIPNLKEYVCHHFEKNLILPLSKRFSRFINMIRPSPQVHAIVE